MSKITHFPKKLRVLTANVNGIRSAVRKGFMEWLAQQQVDVVCLQETRIQGSDIDEALHHLPEYHCWYVAAEKKGYSGVAIFSRIKPDHVCDKLGFPLSDSEGRYLQVDFGPLSIVSLYLPSGSSGEERQACKFAFMKAYEKILKHQALEKRLWVIAGDWNIAHTNKDIKNWRANQNSSGFLPEERAYMDKVLKEFGYVDAFRVFYPEQEIYTWWSARGRARENNVGWRIDYQIVSPALAPCITQVQIFKDPLFSDHAPMIVDYDLSLLA